MMMETIFDVGVVLMMIMIDLMMGWLCWHAYTLKDWAAEVAAIIMALCIALVNYIAVIVVFYA